MRTIVQIGWGTNNENVLNFGYAPRDVRFGRRPRPGSRRDRAPSGVEDAWITGRDYVLAGDFAWIPASPKTGPVQTPWGGPAGVQAFLDWCHDGNTFRLRPDASLPEWTIDGCRLVSPGLDDGEAQTVETDATWRLPLVIGHPTTDLALAVGRGIIFEYEPGASLTELGLTFSRTDPTPSGTTYLDKDGRVRTVAANVLRDQHYVKGVRTTLMEFLRTNQIEWSEDFTQWTAAGTPGISLANGLPLGDLTLYELTDNDAAASEWVELTVTAPTDAARATSFFVARHPSPSAEVAVQVYDFTAAAYRLDLRVTFDANGVPTVVANTGTFDRAVLIGTSKGIPVYRIEVRTTTIIVANTNKIQVSPASSGVGDTGSVYIGGVQLESGTGSGSFCTSYIRTAGAVRSRAGDVLTWPLFPYRPHLDLTFYGEFTRTRTADLSGNLNLSANPRIMSLETIGAGTIRLNHVVDTGSAIRKLLAQIVDALGASSPVQQDYPAGDITKTTAQFKNMAATKPLGPVVNLDVGSGPTADSNPLQSFDTYEGTGVELHIGHISGVGQLDAGIIKVRVLAGLKTQSQAAAA